MTDSAFIKKELRQEIRERKCIGYSAKNRICGSKSTRAATLPSDLLTQKQWKERNGPVNTYNLSQPMSWKVFSSMPSDLQKAYIDDLICKYGVTQTALAKMFGISYHYCIEKMTEFGLSHIFQRGRRMTTEQKNAFQEFLCHEELERNTETSEEQSSRDIQVDEPVQDPNAVMCMDELFVQFSGKIDLVQLTNTIRYMLPEDRHATVSISVKVGDQHDEQRV